MCNKVRHLEFCESTIHCSIDAMASSSARCPECVLGGGHQPQWVMHSVGCTHRDKAPHLADHPIIAGFHTKFVLPHCAQIVLFSSNLAQHPEADLLQEQLWHMNLHILFPKQAHVVHAVDGFVLGHQSWEHASHRLGEDLEQVAQDFHHLV